MEFRPLERMWERIEIAKDDSDTALFYRLMEMGEFVTKLIVGGLLSAIRDDRERSRYRVEYALMRASGIGEWAQAVASIVSGPPAQLLISAAQIEQQELNKNYDTQTWQYDVVHLLNNCAVMLDKGRQIEEGKKIKFTTWFEDFTFIRNKSKGHGAPRAEMMSAMCPIIQQSLGLLIEEFSLFKRPWAYLHKSMSGKYRVTKLTPSAISLDVLKTVKGREYNFPDGVYIHFDEKEDELTQLMNVQMLKTTSDVLDYFVPNGGNTNFEWLSYITDERILTATSSHLAPPHDLPPSETQGLNQLEITERSLATLPPLQEGYISRFNLEQELFEELMGDNYHRIITLVGRGGIGKTSVALKVLHQIAAEGKFTIFWFSARDIDLLPQGPKEVKPHVLTEQHIAEEFARLVQNHSNVSKMKRQEKIDYLNKNLHISEFGPILFVFDNFETVESVEEFYRWLDTYLRPPNKALITTRMRRFKGDYPIEVVGMSDGECHELISTTASKLGISALINSDYRKEIVIESDGHPYVIKVLLGEVAKDGSIGRVNRIIANRDDILPALFQRTYIGLTPAARRIFLTLCNWKSVVPRLAVEAVLIRPQNEYMDVERAIEELAQSSLIDILTSDDDSEEFLNVPLVATVFGQKELKVSPLSSSVEADTKLLQHFGAGQHTDVQHGIAPRIERLFKHVASKPDELSDYLPILEYIARNYPAGWMLLASLYEELEMYEDAKQSVSYYLQTPNTERQWKAWEELAVYSLKTEDYLSEANAMVKMCQIPGTYFYKISNTANRINGLLSRHELVLDSGEKIELIRPLVELMEQNIDEADATDCSRLAWLCLHLRDHAKAKYYAQLGLDIEPENEHCKKVINRLIGI